MSAKSSILKIPPEIHYSLKLRALKERISMKALFIKIVTLYLQTESE